VQFVAQQEASPVVVEVAAATAAAELRNMLSTTAVDIVSVAPGELAQTVEVSEMLAAEGIVGIAVREAVVVAEELGSVDCHSLRA
jgi:hypothetical protein